MAKANNGGSTPKIPAPAAEQDEIRRAKKRKQRERTRTGQPVTQNLTEGLREDRINQFGTRLLDQLEPVMTSSSNSVNQQLQEVLHAYVSTFVAGRLGPATYWDRHMTAKQSCLEQISHERIRRYASARLDNAFSTVKRSLAPSYASAS